MVPKAHNGDRGFGLAIDSVSSLHFCKCDKTVTRHGGVALGLAMAVVINGCRVCMNRGNEWVDKKKRRMGQGN